MNDELVGQILGALVNRNDNDGLGGGNGALWLIIILVLFGGWGNRGGYGGGNQGSGYAGGDALYPWLNQSEHVSGGFRDQMINNGITGIAQSVTGGFADVLQALCAGFGGVNMNIANGFAQAEIAANGRQIANMQQQFAMQTATQQGFNALQAQQAECCCENRLATANQTNTLLSDNEAKTQLILDKLCQLELDGVKAQLAQAERENVGLQNQLNMANLAASQQAQNQLISQGFANEVDALYNRLNSCPVPSMPVYGRTPIFTCNSQNNQDCNCGRFVG